MFRRAAITAGLTILASLSVPAQQPAPPAPARPAAAATSADQQPPVTFRVEVNYVEIDAIVTDAQGNFVRGLSKEDFEVVEEGKPQSLSVLSLVDIPIERADAPLFSPTAIEPDVRSNIREFNGRVFVLVLDDLQTHSRAACGSGPPRSSSSSGISAGQRHRRHRPDRRPQGWRAGVHEQPAAAPPGGQQFHAGRRSAPRRSTSWTTTRCSAIRAAARRPGT